ncbi:MAG: 3-phosphoshikimate 1-carboxyvinyltransferase [Nanoarchaeota archaeon]|nr:3-phosphoshikimate 1-carboxyvinyltransferase [Nanoarchaeota archaeon]
MKLIVKKTESIEGEAIIPGSKSHTIRAFIFASLAEGKSKITNALESGDTEAAINACSVLGAKIEKKSEGEFEVVGFNGSPKISDNKINTLNSGTTTNLIASVACLSDKKIVIDGDDSIRKRPMQPLLTALNNLGATVMSINNNGCPPIEVGGRLKGGRTELSCVSSQYLSSLLISCPLAPENTEIIVKNICEKPYIEMTLKWLDELGIKYDNENFDKIIIYGKQRYNCFEKSIPKDWSSATFLLAAGVLLGRDIIIRGLDLEDSQADKLVLDYIRKLGADIKIEKECIIVNKSKLIGCELDLNNTPDALPAIAVLACHAEGRTIIKNIAHARIKETDRINVMAQELSKMDAKVEEMDEGLIIEHSVLKGAKVKGRNDHRIVMALSLAGLIAEGETIIDTADAVNVTFPGYVKLMRKLGANMEVIRC